MEERLEAVELMKSSRARRAELGLARRLSSSLARSLLTRASHWVTRSTTTTRHTPYTARHGQDPQECAPLPPSSSSLHRRTATAS